MRLYAIATASLIAGTTLAQAETQTDYSSMIKELGLAETAARLSLRENPTPSDQFALGGVNFLRAVERTLQTRYTYGVNEDISRILDLPLLRMSSFVSPAPKPFTPDVIETLLSEAVADFDRALTSLDTVTDADDVAVTIDIADIWFDIDSSGTRESDETLSAALNAEMNGAFASDASLTVKFDTADAAWLSAYAHLLSGFAETMLSLDTSEAITTVMEGAVQLDAITPEDQNIRVIFSHQDEIFADAIAIAVRAIEGQPDPTRTRAAHAHFLGMIADNQTFWSRVARETDDTQEWIPNKNQTSALPIDFPADTGQRWRAVLADAEALLTGEALLPHWRLGEGAGLNLAKLMQDPPEMDIIGIIQGYTVAPYAEQGRVIDSQNMRAFEQLVGGNASLFMVILN